MFTSHSYGGSRPGRQHLAGLQSKETHETSHETRLLYWATCSCPADPRCYFQHRRLLDTSILRSVNFVAVRLRRASARGRWACVSTGRLGRWRLAGVAPAARIWGASGSASLLSVVEATLDRSSTRRRSTSSPCKPARSTRRPAGRSSSRTPQPVGSRSPLLDECSDRSYRDVGDGLDQFDGVLLRRSACCSHLGDPGALAFLGNTQRLRNGDARQVGRPETDPGVRSGNPARCAGGGRKIRWIWRGPELEH